MKFTSFAILFASFATLVCSQSNLAGLPDCAKTCVNQFTSGSSIGGCNSLDIVCICSSAGFLSGIACCLAGQCDAADQATAVSFAQNFCSASGVTNLPSSVSCSSTATNSISTTSSAVNATLHPASVTASTTSSTAAATGKSGAQKLSGIGAGIFGGLVAGMAFL